MPPETDPALETDLTARLEGAFGRVERMGGGYQSRVFLLPERDQVIKVYRESLGLNRLEAGNMIRAGFHDWVVGASNLGDLEILTLRRFPGRPLTGEDIPGALPALRAFMLELHAKRGYGEVNLAGVRVKLARFRPLLAEPDLAPLFAAVRRALHLGTLEVEPSLCHLDLHRENILVSESGRVLVVDWTRADWDDPARDIAIFMTGTLDQRPAGEAIGTALEIARAEGVAARLPAYVALQTLHDLAWFREREPDGYAAAFADKLPRALEMLDRGP